MTKEELIKEAWSSQCPDEVDDNGWFNLGYCVNGLDDVEYWLSDNFFKRNLDTWDIDYIELDNGEFIHCKIRPKSLQGIENNNGWKKVEGQHDLPKETDLYWAIDEEFGTDICEFHSLPKKWYCGDVEYFVSHYKPIEKPKPPLY